GDRVQAGGANLSRTIESTAVGPRPRLAPGSRRRRRVRLVLLFPLVHAGRLSAHTTRAVQSPAPRGRPGYQLSLLPRPRRRIAGSGRTADAGVHELPPAGEEG